MGRYLREHTNPPVFIISLIVIVSVDKIQYDGEMLYTNEGMIYG